VDLECTPEQVLRPRPLRWSLRALDVDILEGALQAGIWPVEEIAGDPEAGARRLGNLMTRACDCAMPRVTPRPRRAAYWWNQEIARLRLAANAARRKLNRIRLRTPWRVGYPGGGGGSGQRFQRRESRTEEGDWYLQGQGLARAPGLRGGWHPFGHVNIDHSPD